MAVAQGGRLAGGIQCQEAARRGGRALWQQGIQLHQIIRLCRLHTQHFQLFAQHQPAAGILHLKAFHRRLYPDDHGAGGLAGDDCHIQVRHLRQQLVRFFFGGKTVQVIPHLNAGCIDQLLFGINAGIGGGGAVRIFHPEIRHLEQQVDGKHNADHQHCQNAQHPDDGLAAADSQLFRAGNAALHLWRAGTVPRLLGVLLGAGALLLLFGRLAFGGLFCGTLAAALWPLLAARRAAAALRRGAFGVAMAGLTLAGRYTLFLVSAALIAVHGVYLLSVFQLLFAAGLFRQVTFRSPVPAALR